MDNMLSYHRISTRIKHENNNHFENITICSVGQRQLEERLTENDKGNHFDMNHLID